MIIAIMINHFYYIFQCHHEKYLHLSKFCCKIFFRLFGFRFKAAKAEFRLSSQLLIANISSLSNTGSVLIHTCNFCKFQFWFTLFVNFYGVIVNILQPPVDIRLARDPEFHLTIFPLHYAAHSHVGNLTHHHHDKRHGYDDDHEDISHEN